MSIKSYKLLPGALDHLSNDFTVEGNIVYKARGYDYGLARDDSMAVGEEFISVTLNENGDYPFFTVPVRYLEQL